MCTVLMHQFSEVPYSESALRVPHPTLGCRLYRWLIVQRRDKAEKRRQINAVAIRCGIFPQIQST